MIKYAIYSFLFFSSILAVSQDVTVKGNVFDYDDKSPLPFATISVLGTTIGTVSNGNGEFELNVEKKTDTLVVNFLGYSQKLIVLNPTIEIQDVYMRKWAFNLDEIVVRPKNPTEYIIEAVSKHASNITNLPFVSRSFFRSKQTVEKDDKKSIKKDEAVFVTNFPNYADSSSICTSKLVLFRNNSNNVKVDIGSVINIKKVTKKAEKRLGNEDDQEKVEEEETEADAGDFVSGKGPKFILEKLQNLTKFPFLEKANFESFAYSFGMPSFYDDRELMVINFKSDKSIELSRFTGSLFLDKENLAIVAIKYKETMKIPIILKPLIKMIAGINMDYVKNNVSIQNQLYKNNWYPKSVSYQSTFRFKKQHFFSENEYLDISEKHLLNLEEIYSDTSLTINKNEIYDPAKDYEEQIHPDSNIKWEYINVVKD